METGIVTRSLRGTTQTEEQTEKSHVDRSYSPELRLATEGMDADEPSLLNIPKELRDFRKHNNKQYAHIRRGLRRVDARMEEAEGRFDETETVLQLFILFINFTISLIISSVVLTHQCMFPVFAYIKIPVLMTRAYKCSTFHI